MVFHLWPAEDNDVFAGDFIAIDAVSLQHLRQRSLQGEEARSPNCPRFHVFLARLGPFSM